MPRQAAVFQQKRGMAGGGACAVFLSACGWGWWRGEGRRLHCNFSLGISLVKQRRKGRGGASAQTRADARSARICSAARARCCSSSGSSSTSARRPIHPTHTSPHHHHDSAQRTRTSPCTSTGGTTRPTPTLGTSTRCASGSESGWMDADRGCAPVPRWRLCSSTKLTTHCCPVPLAGRIRHA